MEWNKSKRGVGLMGVLILLLGFCLVIGGCESDSVVPQEQLPALTERGAAQQASLVAVGISKAGPELLNFSGKSGDKELGVYPYTFPEGADIAGTIMLEYFNGGAEGEHCLWSDADYGLLYTTEGNEVSVALDLEGLEPEFALTFNLYGPIDQVLDTAEVSGTGKFASGDSSHDFTIPDDDPVLLEAISTYPSGGSFAYSADGFDLVVVYDGDDTAFVFVSEAPEPGYVIDLDTGIVTPFEL
jgi:hypothetical protein